MKCPKCGNEIANDSLFCEHCGTKTINGEQQTKRVDIRWCLLPAMIIATIAMGFASESSDIYLRNGQYMNVIPFFVVPSSIFIASCFYGIKKLVPASFVILIVMLFGINCKILYDSVNTADVYRYEVYAECNDSNAYNTSGTSQIPFSDGLYRSLCSGDAFVCVSTVYNYYIKNEEKVKNDLLECAEFLEEKFRADGKLRRRDYDTPERYISKKEEHYTGWKGYMAFFYLSIVLVVYLIYAIPAHKKGWRF